MFNQQNSIIVEQMRLSIYFSKYHKSQNYIQININFLIFPLPIFNSKQFLTAKQPAGLVINNSTMETYNTLLKEFQHQQTPQNYIPNYKHIANQIIHTRTRRKMYLAAKMKELEFIRSDQMDCQRGNHSEHVLRGQSRAANSKLETQTMGKEDLHREILELVEQMEVLGERTEQLKTELLLFESKRGQVEQAEKQSGLQVFGKYQQLLIQATAIVHRQNREQEIIDQLTQRHQLLDKEIQGLVKRKQREDKIIQRWKKSKEMRVSGSRQEGISNKQLNNILRSLYLLQRMVDYAHKGMRFDVESQDGKLVDSKQIVGWQKCKIMEYYQPIINKENIDSDKIIKYYKELEETFDRQQRANLQGTDYLRSLILSHQTYISSLHKLHQMKDRNTLRTLKQKQVGLRQLQDKITTNGGMTVVFTTELFELLKKLNKFKLTLKNTLKYNHALLNEQSQPSRCIQQYESLLSGNPEEIRLEWGKRLGCDSAFYRCIEHNDLLRMYSNPSQYNEERKSLQNYQYIADNAMTKANQTIKQMFEDLSLHFKQGKIKEQQSNKTKRKGKNECKNQQFDTVSQAQTFCVESKQYFRRDDYRLLQKLQKEELRKKGLLVKLPFNLNLETELIPPIKSSVLLTQSRSPSPGQTQAAREMMKYTELATKREENNLKKSMLRKMIGKLGSSSSRNTPILREDPWLNTSVGGPAQSRAFRIARGSLGWLRRQKQLGRSFINEKN